MTRKQLLSVVTLVLAAALPERAAADQTATVVALVTPEWPALTTEALRIELAARGTDLEISPAGADPASAAHQLLTNGFAAVIWIDADSRINALAEAEGRPRQAMLPGPLATVSPRIFALIAASLVGETIAPPQTVVEVHVDVTVDGDSDSEVVATRASTSAPDNRTAAPGLAVSRTASAPDYVGKWYATSGAILAPVAAGVEVDVGRYLGELVAVHGKAQYVWVVPADYAALRLSAALTRARPRRGSLLSIDAGYVSAPDVDGWVSAAWAGWRWPLGKRSTIEARVGVAVGVMDDEFITPVPLGNLTVSLPL